MSLKQNHTTSSRSIIYSEPISDVAICYIDGAAAKREWYRDRIARYARSGLAASLLLLMVTTVRQGYAGTNPHIDYDVRSPCPRCVQVRASAEPLKKGTRPADFYRQVFQRDAAVCDAVLSSLNKKYVLTEEQRDIDKNPNVRGDLLLASALQIPWQRKLLETGGAVDGSLDLAKVDLTGSGHTSFVYRWAFFSRARNMNALFVLDSMPADFEHKNILPESTIQNLPGNEVRITARTIPQIWHEVHEDTFDFNVLVVNGKAFLTIVPALQADRAIERGLSVDAYVLKYQSPQEIGVVCHFKGTGPHVRGNP